MKNKRKTCFTLALTASVCLSAAIPAYADADYMDFCDFFEENCENSCYIIDFMDDDGNLLDSKICAYGEKLTDIIKPEPKEDEEYIYQFVGWEPQISETVTDCAAYKATYQKIRKDGAEEPACTPTPTIQQQPESSVRASSTADSLAPEEVTQVSSTSYDVTRFTLGTPTPKAEVPANAPVSANPASQPSASEKEEAPKTVSSASESPQKDAPNKQKSADAPIPYASSSAPASRNAEILPQPQITVGADTPDTASKNPESNLSYVYANADITQKEKTTGSKKATRSKRPPRTASAKNTKTLSQDAQTPAAKSSNSALAASETALTETKQSSKIGVAVPMLFIGMTIFSGVARITGRRKHM